MTKLAIFSASQSTVESIHHHHSTFDGNEHYKMLSYRRETALQGAL